MRLCLPILLALTSLAAPLGARPTRAEVRAGAVWLDGAPAWRGAVTSALVWSAGGDAVAFTGRERGGRAALVVLVPGAGAPTVLSWPIPRAAQPARVVTWLGRSRLGAGPSELEPRVVASYSVSR